MNDEVNRPPSLRDFQEQQQGRNPFGADVPATRPVGALANAEQQRAIAEVQARMIIARANPRDQRRAMDAIILDCTRFSLAKTALYQYVRGGSSVSGPSIRLAESIARRWGNIASGIKEISRDGGYSECVAYAWDLETGYYDERQFQVKHWRDTKSGGYALTDERDIYELIANMGQRRKRAVMLTVIPGDVIEAAVDQCEETLNANADTSPEALLKMVGAFQQFGVTRAEIEKKCQCRLEAIRPAQVVVLSKIFASLSDGMSKPQDWFEGGTWSDVEKAHAAAATPAKAAPPKKAAEAPAKPTATRKAPAKRAAPDDGPPAHWDEDGAHGDPVTDNAQPPPTKVAETPAEPASPEPEPFGASFDGWLLDEYGEPATDEPDTSPYMFAKHLAELWERTVNRTTLREQNADAIADALATGDTLTRALIEGLIDEPPPAEPEPDPAQEEVPGVMVVPLTLDRGKPLTDKYRLDFKAAVGELVAGNFLDFITLNRPEMAKVQKSAISLCIKMLVEKGKALGIAVPPDLGPGLLTAPAAPTETTSVASDDQDRKQLTDRIAEARACTDIHELKHMWDGIIIKNFRARMAREGKTALAAELHAAFEARGEELKKP